MDEPVIHMDGVHKAYDTHRVLIGVDLAVPAGTVHALLGPNGAGKTTLVRIVSTLLLPDAGTVRVAGHDVVREPAAVRRAISLTGQHAAVDEVLTGEENLLMMGRLCRLSRRAARRRTDELLERFDLGEARSRSVSTYSGGMRRRLDLAVGLLGRPRVVYLDEPTTGLDPWSRQTMWTVIEELVAEGATVLLTTQYLEEADRLADRVTMIDGGRVVAEGTPDELKHGLAGELVELVLADAAALARALAALGGRPARPDPEQRRLRVPTDGTAADVREVLNRLHDADVGVDRVALHRPSLDDVLFSLTGGAPPPPGHALLTVDRAEVRP